MNITPITPVPATLLAALTLAHASDSIASCTSATEAS